MRVDIIIQTAEIEFDIPLRLLSDETCWHIS